MSFLAGLFGSGAGAGATGAGAGAGAGGGMSGLGGMLGGMGSGQGMGGMSVFGPWDAYLPPKMKGKLPSGPPPNQRQPNWLSLFNRPSNLPGASSPNYQPYGGMMGSESWNMPYSYDLGQTTSSGYNPWQATGTSWTSMF